MEEANQTAARLVCSSCGCMGLDDGDDGYFYCKVCGAQAEDIRDTGVGDEDFVDKGAGALYSARHTRTQPTPKPEPDSEPQSISLYKSLSQAAMDIEGTTESPQDLDHVGPTGPSDFGNGKGGHLTVEDYYNEIRKRYTLGMQLMIQYQCEALVNKFGVCPLICGISGSVWLRYVAWTGIFAEDWADEIMLQSEQQEGGKIHKRKAIYKNEPRNIFNHRMTVLWHRSLRKKIPLSCSLAITYLACHIAREPILPTDIYTWSLEGKLPYMAAFVDIEKAIGSHTRACPIGTSYMFRPSQIVPMQKLESLAASIAKSIHLRLPPVNFYAISCRYLSQLSLPVEKILPYAVRLYEWSMPPDLWLLTNELRLPSRVCVMAILIVTIRIIYNINGFGKWEASLSNHDRLTGSAESEEEEDCGSEDSDEETTNLLKSVSWFESEAPEILCNLRRQCTSVKEKHEYSKDLPTYLKYCKDVVFAGFEPLFDDHVEKKMIDELWESFLKNKEKTEASQEEEDTGLLPKRGLEDFDCSNGVSQFEDSLPENGGGAQSSQVRQNLGTSIHESSSNERDAFIRLLKDMEETRFCYIPPREYLKRHDYLHYVRKKDDGSLTYAAHADYYILLRACAKAVKVDVRVMHLGVLKLERRLAWTENRIDDCLQKISS